MIDAMDTLEGVTERAEATPATYAARLAAVNSARDMATVAVNVICESHSEHHTPAPPSGPEYPASHTQSVNSSLPAAELECKGHRLQPPDPGVGVYVPASHAAHANKIPEVQLAVKPSYPRESSDVNRTRRCCPVAAYVASAGVPLSVASATTPDEHAASPHPSTYT